MRKTSIPSAGYGMLIIVLLSSILGFSTPAAAQALTWVPGHEGGAMPPNPVYGGTQNNAGVAFVCRANWANGTHPGKLGNGWCYIPYGADEIKLPSYDVLTGSLTVWAVPNRADLVAVVGGHEGDHVFFICRGPLVLNGAAIGEVVGAYVSAGCQVSYGGHAYAIRNFEELYVR